MYSITYKRCPFCGGVTKKRAEKAKVVETADYDTEVSFPLESEPSRSPAPKGGKRLQKKRGGGFGRIILFFLSLAIIVAAVYIVVTKVVPIVESRFGTGIFTAQGAGQDANGAEETEAKFRLLDTKVTLAAAGETKQLEAVYEPMDQLGTLTWSSDHTDIVVVSSQGKLTAVSPGTALVTATREDGTTAQCEVQCVWNYDEVNTDIQLNRDDFTLRKGDTHLMKVIGTEETPVWSIEDTNVATISDSGLVKYVGDGITKITAQVGGQTLTCILRCKA
jgi:hypothetical protein